MKIKEVIDFKNSFIWGVQRKWRNFKNFLVSENADTEDLVPREWMDKSHLIPHMVLLMTVEFKKEWDSSPCALVDDEENEKFEKWLDKTCYRIIKVLPYIEKRATKALDIAHEKTGKYEEVYRFHDYWEKVWENTTDRLCKEIIDNRKYFWT